ncbi:fimbrial protein [Pseudomonas proteolytica]|uniref:fimbrial protein n=1 Tax=Pseudomonas proteolytica TaxID=219574 RepID=UPI001473E3ED|nr:fimbrial protein [Pseudomonas proteolytica]NMZ32849.1 type 1 fimbrial protein [Pseudomonas proteolytica]
MHTRTKINGLLGLAFATLSGTAMADCGFIDGTNTVDRTVALIGSNITVGRDVPLGTILFKQTFTTSTNLSRVSCDPGIYNVTRNRQLTSTPLPVSSWSGANAGKVYESGVPGVGVYLASEGQALPDPNTFGNCGGGTSFCTSSPQLGFDVFFIKTGDVSPGTIQGASLPSMQNDWISPVNTLILQRVNFVGSINVVARTCVTPDVNVPLGTRSVNEFAGVGTGTPWQSFQISLNNCPAFHGTFPGSPNSPIFDANGDTSTEQGRASNVLGFRLDPTDGVIDAAEGIISLTPAPSGFLPAATGIGIQIGTGDAVPIPVPLATIRPSGVVTTTTEGASYVIPLKARYIQTAASMTPGPANGAVVFTIDYQ